MPIRKKHNLAKRLQAIANATLKDVAIVMSLSATDGKCVLVDAKKRTVGIPTPTMRDTLAGCAFKWTVCLVVRSVESNGKERTVAEYQRMASPYRQEALIDYLNACHAELVAQERARDNDITDAAFVYMPVGRLPEEAMVSLMELVEHERLNKLHGAESRNRAA